MPNAGTNQFQAAERVARAKRDRELRRIKDESVFGFGRLAESGRSAAGVDRLMAFIAESQAGVTEEYESQMDLTATSLRKAEEERKRAALQSYIGMGASLLGTAAGFAINPAGSAVKALGSFGARAAQAQTGMGIGQFFGSLVGGMATGNQPGSEGVAGMLAALSKAQQLNTPSVLEMAQQLSAINQAASMRQLITQSITLGIKQPSYFEKLRQESPLFASMWTQTMEPQE